MLWFTYTLQTYLFGQGNLLTGLSSLGVPGVPWHPQILVDQLTLSQPRGADYSHQVILTHYILREQIDGQTVSLSLMKMKAEIKGPKFVGHNKF